MNFAVIPAHFKFLIPFLACGFFISLVIYPFYIKKLKELQWGQQIREEGPQDHLSKKGTPTMGGLVILFTFVICSILYWIFSKYLPSEEGRISTDYIAFAVVIIANGALGFIDDFMKIKKSQSLGLRARDKLLAHLVIGLALAWYMQNYSSIGTTFFIPLVGFINFGWLLYPFAVAVVSGCVNAVNLTDGLDGLAGGSVCISLCAYCLILLYTGKFDLFIGCIFIIGALFAFLGFNAFPARIFMGDTGSLGLGGALAAISILTGTELILLILGGVYVAEALSVIIQVAYFKKTGGKRIFRMSPIHHHFALGGLHEVQVTTRFWLAGLGFGILGLLTYFGI